ncbi:hypothetical protein FRB94_007779 [Tulasnella sp. JGI-2019a]|nr:hypothetical protein FRB94_007779 [Tulasnella sp. JGI-2019a]
MLDIEGFRKAGYEAVDRICDYYESLEKRPVVAQVEPGYLAKLIPDHAPEEGEPFSSIADDFQKVILPGVTHWQHPSFFAYFPTSSTFEGSIADLYAGSVSSPGFNWMCSPAATELEAISMDWAGRMFGLDEIFMASSGKGGGVIQPTASDSCLTAVVAARSRYSKLHPDFPLEKLVIYGTTMTHSLGAKAALILGLTFRALEVSKEDNYGLRGAELKKALEEDRSAGLAPFIFIATVGTTSSGAIDYLDEIGQVAESYPDLWIHVDAAWAGVVLACPEYRAKCHLDMINKHAQSFCANFHKWGLVNFESSGMWVRDRRLLTDALDITPEYLRTKHGDAGLVIDYRNWQLPLGKRFRALKLWFVLRSYGVKGFQEHIRKGIKQAELFASLVKSSPSFEVVTPPSFSLVVFRVIPPPNRTVQTSLESLNQLNKTFFKHISTRPNVFIVQTDIHGMYCLRMAIGAARTEDRHIHAAFKIFEEGAETALKEWASMST